MGVLLHLDPELLDEGQEAVGVGGLVFKVVELAGIEAGLFASGEDEGEVVGVVLSAVAEAGTEEKEGMVEDARSIHFLEGFHCFDGLDKLGDIPGVGSVEFFSLLGIPVEVGGPVEVGFDPEEIMDAAAAFQGHDAGGDLGGIRPKGQGNQVTHRFHLGGEIVKLDNVTSHLVKIGAGTVGIFLFFDGDFNIADGVQVVIEHTFVEGTGALHEGAGRFLYGIKDTAHLFADAGVAESTEKSVEGKLGIALNRERTACLIIGEGIQCGGPDIYGIGAKLEGGKLGFLANVVGDDLVERDLGVAGLLSGHEQGHRSVVIPPFLVADIGEDGDVGPILFQGLEIAGEGKVVFSPSGMPVCRVDAVAFMEDAETEGDGWLGLVRSHDLQLREGDGGTEAFEESFSWDPEFHAHGLVSYLNGGKGMIPGMGWSLGFSQLCIKK